ncbi:hypothetical protein LJC54_00135 [Parabacteroides sp. OttesenSCG-928-J18]|nr:hypothetical protein [Parabacteroides sp. OttesenSCG-928-J18]
MKKLIKWLAKVFNVNITKEIVVTEIKEKIIYKPINNTIHEDVFIEGNLIVTGDIVVTGDVICYKKIKELN